MKMTKTTAKIDLGLAIFFEVLLALYLGGCFLSIRENVYGLLYIYCLIPFNILVLLILLVKIICDIVFIRTESARSKTAIKISAVLLALAIVCGAAFTISGANDVSKNSSVVYYSKEDPVKLYSYCNLGEISNISENEKTEYISSGSNYTYSRIFSSDFLDVNKLFVYEDSTTGENSTINYGVVCVDGLPKILNGLYYRLYIKRFHIDNITHARNFDYSISDDGKSCFIFGKSEDTCLFVNGKCDGEALYIDEQRALEYFEGTLQQSKQTINGFLAEEY